MTGKLLAGRYQIVEQIGEGGMALVYKARDLRTGHDVAVKFLRPEFRDDENFVALFKREATAASKMTHHNIVNLLDVGSDESGIYIVIEYVDGQTVKDMIRLGGRLPERTAAEIIIRVLSALQHAHGANIIHRDIKPQNILMDRHGYVKVADFGIARMVGSKTEVSTDEPKSVMGSVHYFSPEQAKGEMATPRSDLYSAGVVLYEMLTGAVPFDGDTSVAVAMKHIRQKPVPPRETAPDISPAMEGVVLKALQKNPEDRYASALEMAQAIKDAMRFPDRAVTGRVTAQEDTARHEAVRREKMDRRARRRRIRRRRAMTLAAMVGVMGVLVFGTYAIYNNVVNKTAAPYLLGETEENAVRMVIQSRLVPEVVRQSSTQEAGRVILQSHDFGHRMRSGDKLLITVSTGPARQTVPDLSGMMREEAEKALEKIGLNMLFLGYKMDLAAIDTVLDQLPRANETLETGGIVQVTLSGGQMTMPNLQGREDKEAVRLLRALGIPENKIVLKRVPVENPAQFNQVADQLPREGTVLMPMEDSLEVSLAVYVDKNAENEDGDR